MKAPVLYESHCHTPLCRHAVGEPEEYAAMAARKRLKGVIITCHCPLPDGHSAGVRMHLDQFDAYLDMVARAREAWSGRVDVRLGLESDYYPGVEPWLEKLHRRAPLHHVLGSVHWHIREYRQQYFTGDTFAFQQLYYAHLAESAESGLFDTLAHPDLVKNHSPEEWDFERLRPFVERALDRIAATGVAMELNTSGLLKDMPEMNPGIPQLRMMRERGIPVVLGSDAHKPERVGEHFEDALRILKEAGYSDVSYFLDRQRQTESLDDALLSLESAGSEGAS